MPIKLRFSSVEPREVAEVKRLRDRYRGVLPLPDHPGAVPEGPEEQAIEAVQKPRLRLVGLVKSYIKAHTRKLPSGRTVTIAAHFNKIIPKKDEPGRARAGKHGPPPAGVHAPLTPEQLAHRLVRHVQEGSLTHEEAEANVAHLERRAAKGHGLQHGHGPAWTVEHVREFVGHARGKLKEYRLEIRRKEEEEIRQNREKNEQEEQRRREENERTSHDTLQAEARERRIALAVKNMKGVLSSAAMTPATIESRIQGLEKMAHTGKRLWGGFTKDDMSEIVRRLRQDYPMPKGDERRERQRQDIKARREYREKLEQHHEDERQHQQAEEERLRQKAEKSPPPQAEQKPATYEHVKDTEARLPEERKHNQAHFKDAPPYIQAALRKVRGLTGLNPKGTRGSLYLPGLRQLAFRPQSKEKMYPGYAGPVWRHEYGHHIDFEMSGQRGPQSYTRRDALEQDRQVLAPTESGSQQANRIADTVKATEAFQQRELGGKIPVASGAERAEALAAVYQAHTGLTGADLEALVGTRWAELTLARHAAIIVNWQRKNPKTFLGNIVNPTGAMAMMQDYFGAVTRNGFGFGFGHSDQYYGSTTHYTTQHCTEAYANWVSCHGNSQPVWRKILAHFTPHTDTAFKGMTEQWLNS